MNFATQLNGSPVIPAKAGTHIDVFDKTKMDPGFRRDDAIGFRQDDEECVGRGAHR